MSECDGHFVGFMDDLDTMPDKAVRLRQSRGFGSTATIYGCEEEPLASPAHRLTGVIVQRIWLRQGNCFFGMHSRT